MKERPEITLNYQLVKKVYALPGVTLSGSLYAVPHAQRKQMAQELSRAKVTLHADLFADEVQGVSLGEIRVLGQDSDNIIDVHLLSEKALRFLDVLCRLNVRKIIFPFEGVRNPAEIIQKIRQAGKEPWLAIAPETSLISCKAFLPFLDGVLVMLIPPGTKQQADWTLLAKVHEASLHGLSVGVDGGVTENRLASVIAAGATYLVIGRSLFNRISTVL